MSKCKPTKATIIVVLAILLALTVGTVAFFADRVTHQMQFTTATFTDNGYTITREAPSGPYAAGETITVPITETNTGSEAIKSSIKMTATWSSPDTATARQLFNSAVTLKIGDTTLNYEVSQDKKSITFTLPDQVLGTTAGTKTVTRDLTLTVPEAFVSTGNVTFTFDKATVSQNPVGFSTDYNSSKLAALKCSTQVVWAASTMTNSVTTPNGNKALYGYLNETCDGIIYEMGFGYTRSAMKDFANTSASKWSNYKSVIKTLSFPEGMTTVGDCAFDSFTEVTEVEFPTTTGGIGQYAFNASGLTGELTIPATVNTIEERAFGLLPTVTTITFNHTDSDVLTLPDNKSAGKTTLGAFYVAKHVDTVVNSDVVEIQYEYGWHDGWDNRRLVPMLETEDYWTYTSYDVPGDTYERAINRSTLTSIRILDYFEPADASQYTIWDASHSGFEVLEQDGYSSGYIASLGDYPAVPGTVTAYLSKDGTELILAGNGYGSIYANPNSYCAFYNLYNVETFVGTEMLDMSRVVDGGYMFCQMESVQGMNTTNWDIHNLTDATGMFSRCYELTTLDVSNWDTGNIEYTAYGYYGMFSECYKLNNLNVSNWDTSNMTEIARMFYQCYKIDSLNVSNWDTSKMEDMTQAFTQTAISTLDVKRKTVNPGTAEEYIAWNTANLETTRSMFDGCTSLTALDITSWSVGKLTNTSTMFSGCTALKSMDLSTWDESVVVDAYGMFQLCSNLQSINLVGWDMSDIVQGTSTDWTGSSSMFAYCTSLTDLTIPASMTQIGEHFATGCTSLTEITFLHDANADVAFPTAGVNYGAFYVSSYVATTFNFNGNEDAEGYGWAADNRLLVPTKLTITTQPTTTTYTDGDNFEKAGMVVTATFNDGSTRDVTAECVIEDGNNLTEGKTTVTVSYTLNGVTKKATVAITVEPAGITITYDGNGGTFSAGPTTNVVVYDPDTKDIVSGEEKLPSRVNYSFVGWYTEKNGNTEFDLDSTNANTTVYAKWRANVLKIEITNAPTKTTYNHGDTFDKAGMVVTATYADGTTKVVDDYKLTNDGELLYGQTSIKITYTENGITVSTSLDVTVNNVLDSIAVTTPPDTLEYAAGDAFDKTGMVVTAYYGDGSEQVIDNYTVTNGDSLTGGQESVTISYTENGVTKTTEVEITVPVPETQQMSKITFTSSEPNDFSLFFDDEFVNFDAGENVFEVPIGTEIKVKADNQWGAAIYHDGVDVTTGQQDISVAYTFVAEAPSYDILCVGSFGEYHQVNIETGIPDGMSKITFTVDPDTEPKYFLGGPYDGNVYPGQWYVAFDGVKQDIARDSAGTYSFYVPIGTELRMAGGWVSGVVEPHYNIDNEIIIDGSNVEEMTNIDQDSGLFDCEGYQMWARYYDLTVEASSYNILIEGKGAWENVWYYESANFNVETTGDISAPKIFYTDGNGTITGLTIYGKSLSTIEVPSELNGEAITAIGPNAFSGCSNITSLTLADSITSIGSNAFSGCTGITSLTIPEDVTSIGSGAFKGCTNLASVNIPAGVTAIESSTFQNCSKLTSIDIPANVTSIGSYAFSGCSGLTSVEIPAGVTSIGAGAFQNCSNLTSVNIPDGVTAIENYTFQNCNKLANIVIPGDVMTIGRSAFQNCSKLTNVTIPAKVTTIGASAFNGCSGITKINIPGSIESIGARAFYGCDSATTIHFEAEDSWSIAVGSQAFYTTTEVDTTVLLNHGDFTTGLDWAAANRNVIFQNTSIDEGLNIVTMNGKFNYVEGESFDTTGMTLAFKDANGNVTNLTPADCTITPSGALSADDTQVSITYAPGNGYTYTIKINITVEAVEGASVMSMRSSGSLLNKAAASEEASEDTFESATAPEESAGGKGTQDLPANAAKPADDAQPSDEPSEPTEGSQEPAEPTSDAPVVEEPAVADDAAAGEGTPPSEDQPSDASEGAATEPATEPAAEPADAEAAE